MRRGLIILLIIFGIRFIKADAIKTVIDSAFVLEKADINKSYELMKEAVEQYPDNPDILSVYGYMTGFLAKETYMLRAAMLVSKAISAFDKALEIEPQHKNAKLWRGILKINMPSFLGKVPEGITDLEEISLRTDLSEDDFVMTNFFLGMGYGKIKQADEAVSHFEEVINLGKEDIYYQQSLERRDQILTEYELVKEDLADQTEDEFELEDEAR